MKKTINILSIISLAIAGFSLLLAIALLSLFWEPMCSFFAASEDVIGSGPIIPIGSLVSMVGCLIAAVIVCFLARSNRVIVVEIISIILLVTVLPFLSWLLSMVQTVGLGRIGVNALTSLNTTSSIIGIAQGFMSVSSALCLVVCGMSISEKAILRKG